MNDHCFRTLSTFENSYQINLSCNSKYNLSFVSRFHSGSPVQYKNEPFPQSSLSTSFEIAEIQDFNDISASDLVSALAKHEPSKPCAIFQKSENPVN